MSIQTDALCELAACRGEAIDLAEFPTDNSLDAVFTACGYSPDRLVKLAAKWHWRQRQIWAGGVAMTTTLDYVRIDGDAAPLATPEQIEIARRIMRERGIDSLPILRGTIHASDVPTGLRLRANVNGVRGAR